MRELVYGVMECLTIQAHLFYFSYHVTTGSLTLSEACTASGTVCLVVDSSDVNGVVPFHSGLGYWESSSLTMHCNTCFSNVNYIQEGGF